MKVLRTKIAREFTSVKTKHKIEMAEKWTNSFKGKNGGYFPLALALGGMAGGFLYLKIQKEKKNEANRQKAAKEASVNIDSVAIPGESKLPKIEIGKDETKTK